MMPTGNSDDRDFVQTSAVSLTLIGMVVLICEVVRKSQEKVMIFSNFNSNEEEENAEKL